MKNNVRFFCQLALTVTVAVAFAHCGAVNLDLDAATEGVSKMPAATDVTAAVVGCPNLASVSALGKTDFQSEFGIGADAAVRLKSALKSAIYISAVSESLTEELYGACAAIAQDLGMKPGEDVKTACKAALKAINAQKKEIGGEFSLLVSPPVCTTSLDAMAKCAADCDGSIDSGNVDVDCKGGKLSGQCSGQCSGRCDIYGSAECGGTCVGSCDELFSGECMGKCDGKCDGKDTKGPADCAGTCSGSCSIGAQGECEGLCEGECHMDKEGSCTGICTGDCSVAMESPACTGEVIPPSMSATCTSECDTKINGFIDCSKPRVVVKFVGVSDKGRAKRLAGTIEKNLPMIINIAVGMKDNLVRISQSTKTMLTDVTGSISGMAKGASAGAAKLTACVVEPLSSAVTAASDIAVNVDVSVKVQGHISASAVN